MPIRCSTKPLEFEVFGRCRLVAKKLIFFRSFLVSLRGLIFPDYA